MGDGEGRMVEIIFYWTIVNNIFHRLKQKNGSIVASKQRVVQREVDAEDVIEKIFSQNGSWELSEPVPLNQMVEILIDFWEAEGLYDWA
jgi:hypothetical protein